MLQRLDGFIWGGISSAHYNIDAFKFPERGIQCALNALDATEIQPDWQVVIGSSILERQLGGVASRRDHLVASVKDMLNQSMTDPARSPFNVEGWCISAACPGNDPGRTYR